MKKIISLSLISFALLLMFSCKKDDYDLTLLKIYGSWNIDSYKVNGADSLNLYKDSLGSNYSFYYNDSYRNKTLKISGNTNSSAIGYLDFTWSLSDDFKTIKITSAKGSSGTGPIGNDLNPEWSIISLADTFKLETNYLGTNYVISLVK
jgi:hypothetical protein